MTDAKYSHAPSRCIIHIGMHKTGSTSIQRSLEGFADNEFLYARLGARANHSLPIYSLFAPHPERHHLHRIAGINPDTVRKYNDTAQRMLDTSLSNARGRTLLISGEDIGALAERDLAKLRDYFQSRFEQLTIVAYVRPPAGYITSSFQERVKNGGMKTFRPKRMYRNYRASFGKLDRVFGGERVRLWKFDPSGFPDGDVVRHFCESLGIALRPGRIVRANESLSRCAVAALYTYNKFGNNSARNIFNDLGESVSERLFKGDKFRFSPDLIRTVLANNRSDIEWMEIRLGQSLTESLGEHKAGDVSCEADLLRPDPQFVARLRAELGRAAPSGIKGETPTEVVALIEALRARRSSLFGWIGWRVSAPHPNEPGGKSVPASRNVIDVIERNDRRQLGSISSELAKVLVAGAFNYICSELTKATEGCVGYNGLGSFDIGTIEKNTGDLKTRRIRIRYRPDTDWRPQSGAKPRDVIGDMQQQDSRLLHGIAPQQARELLSNVFSHINRRLARTKEGTVTCEGLGRFRVLKPVRNEKRVRQRIIFHPQSALDRTNPQ